MRTRSAHGSGLRSRTWRQRSPDAGLDQSKCAAFCVEALEKALAKYGALKIFNTDQGSQFTSSGLIDVLTDAKVKIRMDGKSRWIDKRMIKRLYSGRLGMNAFTCTPRKDAQRRRLVSTHG